MAYKYSKGEREFGDIEYENDAEGNTKIDFDEDYIALQVGGASTLVVSGSSVGVGVVRPEATLQVHSDSENGGTVVISQAHNSGDASQLDLSKSRGSGASPSAVQNNDFVGQIRFLGYDGNSHDNFADVYTQAAGVISTTSHPTKMIFRTTQASNTSPSVALTIDEDQNLDVAGNLSFPDVLLTELSIPGVDVQTDTNAYRFNCPYNLTVNSLSLNLDQHTTSGPVQVTVTNTTTSNTMITLSITGTNLGANTTSVSNASAAQGDVITFAITSTPANAQGLRAALGFRRDL